MESINGGEAVCQSYESVEVKHIGSDDRGTQCFPNTNECFQFPKELLGCGLSERHPQHPDRSI